MNLVRKYKISKITNKPLTGIELEIISFIEEWLKDLIPFEFEDNIYYMKKDGRYVLEFIQTLKSEYFYVRWNDFWRVMENEYKLNYTDIQKIIKFMVETTFKSKVGTPTTRKDTSFILVENTFNSNVGTPLANHSSHHNQVENIFKLK